MEDYGRAMLGKYDSNEGRAYRGDNKYIKREGNSLLETIVGGALVLIVGVPSVAYQFVKTIMRANRN